MRVVVARLWESKRAEKLALIHPYDVDLNDRETLAEIQAINPTLDNAISHDIAAGGMLSPKFSTSSYPETRPMHRTRRSSC